jgi:hypothetical protein
VTGYPERYKRSSGSVNAGKFLHRNSLEELLDVIAGK